MGSVISYLRYLLKQQSEGLTKLSSVWTNHSKLANATCAVANVTTALIFVIHHCLSVACVLSCCCHLLIPPHACGSCGNLLFPTPPARALPPQQLPPPRPHHVLHEPLATLRNLHPSKLPLLDQTEANMTQTGSMFEFGSFGLRSFIFYSITSGSSSSNNVTVVCAHRKLYQLTTELYGKAFATHTSLWISIMYS